MQCLYSFLTLIGRVCISVIFILSGIGKFMDYHSTAAYMAAQGMTMIPFFLYAAAIIEVVLGLALLVGWKTRWTALILALYLIPVTLVMHNFWAVEDAAGRTLQMINFLKNVAIFGGLLFIAGSGAGGCAIDSFCGCKPKPEEKK